MCVKSNKKHKELVGLFLSSHFHSWPSPSQLLERLTLIAGNRNEKDDIIEENGKLLLPQLVFLSLEHVAKKPEISNCLIKEKKVEKSNPTQATDNCLCPSKQLFVDSNGVAGRHNKPGKAICCPVPLKLFPKLYKQ